MRRLLMLLFLALALMMTIDISIASATTVIIEPTDSHLPYQRWIDESEVPTPEVTLEVTEQPPGEGCPFVQHINACTVLTEHHIWIGAAELVRAYPRAVFMHEIGHYFTEGLPEWVRERFDTLYGIGVPWQLPEGEMSGEEWFAEAYAECSVKSYITKAEWNALGSGPIFGSRGIFGGFRVAHNKTCRMIKGL